jgi:hypothetical protein
LRSERRDGDGGDQQDGGDHGQDALGNQLNNFSFSRLDHDRAERNVPIA